MASLFILRVWQSKWLMHSAVDTLLTRMEASAAADTIVLSLEYGRN